MVNCGVVPIGITFIVLNYNLLPSVIWSITCTEAPEKAYAWLGELSLSTCLTFLPGPAWVLLSKTYKPFPGSRIDQFLLN